jgi:predicted extracellular nuclease
MMWASLGLVSVLLLAAGRARGQCAAPASLTAISDVQGGFHDSQKVGQQVTVQGVVTLVEAKGFYIQVRVVRQGIFRPDRPVL